MTVAWAVLAVAGPLLVAATLWRLGLGRAGRWAGALGVLLAGAAGIGVVLCPAGSAIAWGSALISSAALAVAALVVNARWRVDRADADRLRRVAARNADQVSVVSHEIRTPLALIKGAADLLEEQTPGPLTDVQTRYVATISRNCSSVIALAEDLLTQARIDAGMFQMHLVRVRLRTVAQRVIADLRGLHTLPIALDAPGAPAVVWADAELMRQALVNLINNCVAHATAAHMITLRIVSRDDQVLISVSDDGQGIDEAARARLFERFASGRPLRDGTGLGLVITRQIVQMHGGRLLVDSSPGGGTTMLATLPAAGSRPDAVVGLDTQEEVVAR